MTTSILVLNSICRFHTMTVGIGMIIRSMKMLSAQLVRMKVRESMHVPPRLMLPAASTVSMAGLSHVYRTGLHCRMLPREVLTAYKMLSQKTTWSAYRMRRRLSFIRNRNMMIEARMLPMSGWYSIWTEKFQ